MATIKAGIIGATGYAGIELVRLLIDHPYVEIAGVSSVSFEGKSLSDIYPMLKDIVGLRLTDAAQVIERSDVVFGALPHGLSEEIALETLSRGKAFIDLGADFRLESEIAYQAWYGQPFTHPDLHQQAVYGLCELYREELMTTKLVANPGCYPTAAALGLTPALEHQLIDTGSIIIDAKSGVTGAGRSPTPQTHFPECNESFAPYKIASHRHTPEIEQTLSAVAGEEIVVTFVPHLLPVNRGIEETIYADLRREISIDELYDLYVERYCSEDFIRVLAPGNIAAIKNVTYSNYCDISLHLDPRAHRLIVVCCIDNMIKGAAGQAIQNMNILFELPDFTGLGGIPPAF